MEKGEASSAAAAVLLEQVALAVVPMLVLLARRRSRRAAPRWEEVRRLARPPPSSASSRRKTKTTCAGGVAAAVGGARLKEALDASINNNGSSYSSQKNITLFDSGYLAQLTFSDQEFNSSASNTPECIVDADLNPQTVIGADSEQFDKRVSKLMNQAR
ncbi:hypothetical protein BAE44_0012931 [Dichanthelium oligosanthes]|uniref:Uncharacterized protein n=1 Tax=Dichanthelium oligosanthes TaxID=888268 RepID=A0A1E5VLP1_9POAL|nr:hypothetical protein BAE44_0012931 [Dichanthelium oligosanthes]